MGVTHGMRTMEQNGHAPGHGSAQKQLSQVRPHVLDHWHLRDSIHPRQHTVATYMVYRT